MRSLLSFIGSLATTTAGIFVLHSLGFRPELSTDVLLWAGAVFGFINWMVIEGWNAFRPSLTVTTAFESAFVMGSAFALLTLLTFYSNQAPVGVNMTSAILTTGGNVFALTLFSAVGFWFGAVLGNKVGSSND